MSRRILQPGVALLALVTTACTTPLYRNLGDQAWDRGDEPTAVANYQQALRDEKDLLQPAELQVVQERVAQAATRLVGPAWVKAEQLVKAGGGWFALDLLQRLLSGQTMAAEAGAQARHVAVPPEDRRRGERLLAVAIQQVLGLDEHPVATPEDALATLDRTMDLRAKIQGIPSDVRDPAIDAVVHPALPVIWPVADAWSDAHRTVEATELATHIREAVPATDVQDHAREILRRAAAWHSQRAMEAAPRWGLQLVEGTLASRFGGSVPAAAQEQKARLTGMRWVVSGVQGCDARMANGLRSALEGGPAGYDPVMVEVQASTCRTSESRWTTTQSAHWDERVIDRVPVRQVWTESVPHEKCEYKTVYANTTCHTDYYSKREVCHDNTNQMQVCHTEYTSVQRERTVIEERERIVQHPFTRTIYHVRADHSLAGQAVVRWPEGERRVSFSRSLQDEDAWFSDKAGSRQARGVSSSDMEEQAISQARAAVHGVQSDVLASRGRRERNLADAARSRGETDEALDRAIRAGVLGVTVTEAETRALAARVQAPATRMADYLPVGSALRAEKPTRTTLEGPSRRAVAALGMPVEAWPAFVGKLTHPPLPEHDAKAARLYQELERHDSNSYEPSFGLDLGYGPSPLAREVRPLLLTGRLSAAALEFLLAGTPDAQRFGASEFQAGLGIAANTPRNGRPFDLYLRYERETLQGEQGQRGKTTDGLMLGMEGDTGSVVGVYVRMAWNLFATFGDEAIRRFHPLGIGLNVHLGNVGYVRGGAAFFKANRAEDWQVTWASSLGMRF
jgi:hypothetical protein